MTMQRWDPFNEMTSLRSVIDRLFDDAFVRAPAAQGQQGGMWMPLDIYEKGDSIVVRASLPGIKPEDINITVQGNTVSIEGELKDEGQQHGTRRHQEHRYGRFFRSVTLPTRVDADKAQANFENGMLTLSMPKEEGARTRQIPVQAGASRGAIETSAKPQAEPAAAGNGRNQSQR
jgi:HSP20 family protein